MLSPEEEEAELIFRAFVHGRISPRAFARLAAELQERCPEANDYLVWLLVRRPRILISVHEAVWTGQ